MPLKYCREYTTMKLLMLCPSVDEEGKILECSLVETLPKEVTLTQLKTNAVTASRTISRWELVIEFLNSRLINDENAAVYKGVARFRPMLGQVISWCWMHWRCLQSLRRDKRWQTEITSMKSIFRREESKLQLTKNAIKIF